MDTHDDAIEALAALSRQAALMSHAVLEKDFDKARVHLARIAADAADEGQESIVVAAQGLARVLRAEGSIPAPGYGGGILELAEALDAAQENLLAR
ncbi:MULTISPECIES: hypothetical protein [unclassified Luteibacter]|jgi:hypothetical protein|uniref:hypothetical protein n=1 Tax=Luteibacter sp. PvP019 TaxID=3156436 RepID=UPI0033998593